ncbi:MULTISPECIES: DUF3370 domain-containing protein [Limnospira]|jgi:hypothetical protein|uniref:DUF3370 domain-containing protein n=1 Tax=Limnospira platensis NIES-46 TaxID=1236695 RepID=A0A5M3TBP0_LIMPL|nr:DUF3370 domain-containing protein [Arthrospira platensis]AMW30173.1 hypothetical protein AP285_21820 [Arthrospira platensis YZ]KDR54125.1 hypothetical protein APPUASWS_031795 [Arthrospira platensis str. Paraca]MBD2670502.1 DUF3370 domain-containing protein [Arthrospira platensis FACHB-439]MBD2711770.1 DUF3370 domain-containing protein [Arthrospira platensis FACHB-835]MDF2207927.1 DUF3370 domain-containing protein [Arthrospira platensis NCB002]MDT9183619.1 DUF3370 domain-containing protein 
MKDRVFNLITSIFIVALAALGGALAGILFRVSVVVPVKSQVTTQSLTWKSPKNPLLAALNPQGEHSVAIQPGEVRPLPGALDDIPMFNSNSPEWVKQEGILLSTFPPHGKAVPEAHLDYPLGGEFELFAHHFVHTPPESKTLYIGILVYNPHNEPVRVHIPAVASYLLEPDAPFQEKPPMADNSQGNVYSGPGIRAVDAVMRGTRLADFPSQLEIPPGEMRMLLNHPIPVKGLERPVNGRSTFMRLNCTTSGTAPTPSHVYVASLAMYAKMSPDGKERSPELIEWQNLLHNGGLAQPRDRLPTPPEQTTGQLVYSRVAGVQKGSKWQADLVDEAANYLTIPEPGKAISYVISTIRSGTLGTRQIQAAELAVRYPDTAYQSHGNYGVHYDLTTPLFNPTDTQQVVTITLETPQKEENLSQGGLMFRQPPWDFPYFRGTVRLQYHDDRSVENTKYLHLWHRRGQIVEPLLTLKLKPQETRLVRLDFRYPPDATPPQVVTIRTLK